MKDFLINQKHLDVLNHINKNKDDTFSNIYFSTGITYSHLIGKTKSELIHYNLITIKKSGRSVLINLTEKGKEALYYAKELDKILNGGKQDE